MRFSKKKKYRFIGGFPAPMHPTRRRENARANRRACSQTAGDDVTNSITLKEPAAIDL
jgi:hypothetical protein